MRHFSDEEIERHQKFFISRGKQDLPAVQIIDQLLVERDVAPVNTMDAQITRLAKLYAVVKSDQMPVSYITEQYVISPTMLNSMSLYTILEGLDRNFFRCNGEPI